jgi:CheY-like chemotaxis protein
MQLLIVEDNADTTRILRRFLGELGEIDLASTVDEAVALAQQKRYDLVLSDIQLAEERTGIDLLHILRQDPRYTSVPIIACTAYLMRYSPEMLIGQGFNGVVGKPFTKNDLLREIRRHWKAVHAA